MDLPNYEGIKRSNGGTVGAETAIKRLLAGENDEVQRQQGQNDEEDAHGLHTSDPQAELQSLHDLIS